MKLQVAEVSEVSARRQAATRTARRAPANPVAGRPFLEISAVRRSPSFSRLRTGRTVGQVTCALRSLQQSVWLNARAMAVPRALATGGGKALPTWR
jgi:uncharacterized protein (DUF3084 family)